MLNVQQDTPETITNTGRIIMTGNIFWHHMNVSRKERYAYIKELKNSYKVGRDDTGKGKSKGINSKYNKT